MEVGTPITEDAARVVKQSLLLRTMEKERIGNETEETVRRRKEALKTWRKAVDKMQRSAPP